MKKRATVLFVALVLTMAGYAQFEKGKVYVNTSLTGLNLSYNGSEDTKFGIEGQVGYLFYDNLMALGEVSYEHRSNMSDIVSFGLRGRYYIVQNGLYLGAGAKYIHQGSYNDVLPGVEIGYAFFLNRNLTVEPAIYYDQSIKKHSDYSTVGLKIGFGFYF